MQHDYIIIAAVQSQLYSHPYLDGYTIDTQSNDNMRIALSKVVDGHTVAIEKRVHEMGNGKLEIQHWNLHPLRKDLALTHTTTSRTNRLEDDMLNSIISTAQSLDHLMKTMNTPNPNDTK